MTGRIGREVISGPVDATILLGLTVLQGRKDIDEDVMNQIRGSRADLPALNPSVAVESRGHVDVHVVHHARSRDFHRLGKPHKGIRLAQLPFGRIGSGFGSLRGIAHHASLLEPG